MGLDSSYHLTLEKVSMSSESIQLTYNENLQPLEKALSQVKRPGNFYVKGQREIPLPKIEVESVGILSFPIQKNQVQQLIQQATRAPYGRGAETIVDTSVRNVWQISPDKIRITSTSWNTHFGEFLSTVQNANL